MKALKLWMVLVLLLVACADPGTAQPPEVVPTPALTGLAAERREVLFTSEDIQLAGELDLPPGQEAHALLFIIHHSGPVTRDAYGYLAELALRQGFAIFRFDKRGTGASGGTYGCCEAADAVAAYRAAIAQPGIDRTRTFIVAQSIGTTHLAERFAEFQQAQPPRGVALLSNLLMPDQILAIKTPVLVIVADSEAEMELIGPAAVAAHTKALPYGAELFIAKGAEHTLFDIRDKPIDWSDPDWVERYHREAMERLFSWLKNHSEDNDEPNHS